MCGEIRVGTSGWSSPLLADSFYRDVPRRAWLAHSASRFDAVEINASYYRLQSESTFARWREQTPEGFRFSVKASRRITHIKRLKNPEDETEYLFRVLGTLGQRLGGGNAAGQDDSRPVQDHRELRLREQLRRLLERARAARGWLDPHDGRQLDVDDLGPVVARDVDLGGSGAAPSTGRTPRPGPSCR